MDAEFEKEPKPSYNATCRRLFPEAVKSGFPKDLKRPTLEELTETCRKFGDSENLYGPVPVTPDLARRDPRKTKKLAVIQGKDDR